MPSYTSCSIYKITSSVQDDPICYIVSTASLPKKRESCHRSLVGRRSLPLYDHFLAIGKDKMVFTVVETYRCTCRQMLNIREAHWLAHYRLLGYDLLNTNRPHLDRKNPEYIANVKQRYQDHKDELKIARNTPEAKLAMKQYYLANKERIKARSHRRYHNRIII